MLTDGGREPDSEDVPGAGEGAGSPPEELLVSAGVLGEDPEGSDLRLTPAFERAWTDRIEQMRGGDRAVRWLAASRGVDPEDLTVTESEDRFAVELDGSPIQEWPSEASFLAGIVAVPTLKEWLPDDRWEGLAAELREGLVPQLMLFLEACPTCDGRLDFTEEVTDGSVHLLLECPDCGATLLEGEYG